MHEPAKRDPLQMALAEAISHGANQADLDRLRQHFEEIACNKSGDEDRHSQQMKSHPEIEGI
jgi:hypothetical protein